MENPYQAPQSNVDNGIVEAKRKRGWKVLFWVLLVLQIFSMVFIFTEDEPDIYELVSTFAIYPLVLIGLFAYAYNKRILFPSFWRFLLVVSLVSDVYSIFMLVGSDELVQCHSIIDG